MNKLTNNDDCSTENCWIWDIGIQPSFSVLILDHWLWFDFPIQYL